MTDRVQTVAVMAATLEAHGSPASVEEALALYREVERQVAAAYPAPTSKDLPPCLMDMGTMDCGMVHCPRHGA